MRRFALYLGVIAMVACAKDEPKPAPDAAPAAPTPAPVTLADFAGKWSMSTMALDNDSVLVSYELVATADSTGWRINFPGRKQPVAVHILGMGGDSIMTKSDSYESMLRKGVQVTTNTVFRLKDGKLTGTVTAHYSVKTADSTRNLRAQGTKTP